MTGRQVSGLVVAVTGAANGIGKEIARALAAAGARVAIGDLDAEASRSTAVELPGSVVGHQLDVTDAESFTAFVDAVERELGPIDVLVNNAGVMWVGPFGDEPEAAMRRVLEVNLFGVIRGVKLVAPGMAARGRGHIITIASAASFLAPPGEATYAASKHGVRGYLATVRSELHRQGVDITMIMPAVVDTDLAAGTSRGAARLLHPAEVADAVLKAVVRPRFEVSVPAYMDPLNRMVNLLPRGLRDVVFRRLVPDQVRLTDRSVRATYESQFSTAFVPDPSDEPQRADGTVW